MPSNFTYPESGSTLQCRIHGKVDGCKELKQNQEQDDPSISFVKQLSEMNGQGAKLSKRSPWSTRYFIRLGNTASFFRNTGRVLNIKLFPKGSELLNGRIGF
jgi:hypothetical protein